MSYFINFLDCVDNINKDKENFDFQAVYNSFFGKMKEIKEMFGDKKNISFSEAYKNCVGECMEKSLSTFLLLRNSKDLDNQLIINGSATDNIDLGVEMHSYNMIKKKMKGIY